MINIKKEYYKRKRFLKYVSICIFVSILGFLVRFFTYDLLRITVFIIEPLVLIGTWVLRYNLEKKFNIIKD